MLFKNSPHGASLSVHYEVNEFMSLVKDFITPYLQTIDPAIEVDMSAGEFDLYLYIEGLGWEDTDRYELDTIDKLAAAGFGMDGGENLEEALRLMCPGRSVKYTLDARTNEVILESYGEGKQLLEAVENLYESLDDLNREEAAELIALLYQKVKQLNWR